MYFGYWRITGEEEEVVLGDDTCAPLVNSTIQKYLYCAFLIHSEWAPLEKTDVSNY